MYKYVFCDLDATLFDDDKNISDKNYKASLIGVDYKKSKSNIKKI